jgi:hypothetical protein
MDEPERRLTFSTMGPTHPASTEIPRGAIRPWSKWARMVAGSPGQVALLWALVTVLGIAHAVIFPGDHQPLVTSTLYLIGGSVFSGLVIAWVLRLGVSTLHLLSALLALRLLASLAAFALKLATPAAIDTSVDAAMSWLTLLAIALIVYFGYGAARSRGRRIAAIVLGIGAGAVAAALLHMDMTFWDLSAKAQALLGRPDVSQAADNQPPDIDDDILWGAQADLVEKERAALAQRVPGKTNVYALAVAGSGTQALFSREAREALRVAALHFGDDSRGGALLSNGAIDQMKSPLATRANIAAVAQAIGDKADRKQDLLFVYLVSHGGQTAELESDLPNYRAVQPISSVSTAQALKAAGIARRVVVVSACYSATWIPALADDNTIVITAAAKDRTSFGCDDTRHFTVFGEAFLGSLAARNVSLHDAFEDAKRKISVEEQKEKVTPSLPQVSVGRNMETLWMSQHGRQPGA